MSHGASSQKKFLATQPPAHLPDGGGEGYPCLLNLQVYVADSRNATTASCPTEAGGGSRVQLTVFAARPPQVSYLCVCCPGQDPDVFAAPPYIIASDADLLLLSVVFGPYSARYNSGNYEYYVYQAAGRAGGAPSIQLIPRPGPSFVQVLSSHVTGILRYNVKKNSCPGPPGCTYTIAAVNYTSTNNQFELHVYHSWDKTWSKKLVLRDHDPKQQPFRLSHKVITIGGDAGTMAWVDLWRGILFYDLLGRDDGVFGRYVSLPPTPLRSDQLDGCPLGERDIAIINGRISYIELQIHARSSKSARERCTYVSYGWTAFMWSMSAAHHDPSQFWCLDCKLKASDVYVVGDNKLPSVESLPRLEDDEGEPRPALARLHCGHPTLCLLNEQVFYLMSKIDFRDQKAWVLAVDPMNKTLQAVAEFTADRIGAFSFTYRHTSLSEYLKRAPGTLLDPHEVDVHGTQPVEISSAQRSIKGARLRFKLWDEFDIVECDQNGACIRVKCKRCETKLSWSTEHGTVCLQRHIRSCFLKQCEGNYPLCTDATTNLAPVATGLIYPVNEEEMRSRHTSEELTQTAGTWPYLKPIDNVDLSNIDGNAAPRSFFYGADRRWSNIDISASQADISIENADVPITSDTLPDPHKVDGHGTQPVEISGGNAAAQSSNMGRLRSKLCDVFEAIEHDQNGACIRLKCKRCETKLFWSDKYGTGPVQRHLNKVCFPKQCEGNYPLCTADATTNLEPVATGLICPVKEDEMRSRHASEELTQTAGTWHYLDQTNVQHGATLVDISLENDDVATSSDLSNKRRKGAELTCTGRAITDLCDMMDVSP